MSRQNEDLAAKVFRPESTHQFKPRHARHPMIGDDDVKRCGCQADLNQCLPAVLRRGYLGGWTSQHHCGHVGKGFFIFDNQNLQRVGHGSAEGAGRRPDRKSKT